jgi:hypothetical protein
VTVEDLLKGTKVDMPGMAAAYITGKDETLPKEQQTGFTFSE